MTFFGSRVWLALGTIAAYTAAGAGSGAAQAVAQGSGDRVGSQAQLPVRRFNIPAGPLDSVLGEFKKSTGVEILYSLPQETIPGFKSRGVSGLYSQAQALRKILAGTGLSFSFAGQDTVTIRIAPSRSSVEVTANNIDGVALTKFPLPLVDTPQSIMPISAAVLSAEGVTTMRDALRNAPGISLAAGEGGAQGDNLTIRGFTAQNDIFLDGMRDIGNYYRDPFDDAKIDVIEGPAGVDFGRGSTGGVINQETKEPLLHPLIDFEGDLGTDLTRRFTADINQPLPYFAGGSAFRLNLMVDDAGVAERNVAENRRYGIAPSFTLGFGSATHLNASYFHFAEDDIPDYGLPWYFGEPAPAPRRNYYGFAHDNFLRTNVDIGTVTVEHVIGVHALVRNMVRYANYQRKWLITEPQVNNASSGIITPATPLDQVMVNRNQLGGHSVESLFWDQIDLTLSGRLLGIRQTGVLGAEGGKETSDPVRTNFRNAQGINTVPLTSLLDPDPGQPFSGVETPRSNTHTKAHSFGVYLLDSLQLGRRWALSGGIRWDRFDAAQNAVNYAFDSSGNLVGTPSNFIQPVDKPTWRGAVVYKLLPAGSIYFDYGTSFDPSAEALSLTAATAATPPEANQTFEVGSKWNLKGGLVSVRGAIFRTTKENAREPDPTDSSIDVLAGNQRVDGAEGVVQGHLTDRWSLLADYTLLHSEVVRSRAYPFAVGQPLNNVPENIFNLWTECQLPHGLEIGGGANFVGERTANTATLTPSTTPERAPGYATFNAMAKLKLSDRVSIQANVDNLTNRFFIDELYPGHAVPGAGASALLGMKLKF